MTIIKTDDLLIVSLDGFNYGFLVIGLSESSPIYAIKKVAKDYFKDYDGQLLIDSVYRQGNTTSRFSEVEVKNGEIVDGSRKIVPLSRKESLRIKANENFRAEEEVVKHSILSSSQKAMLLAGISI
ncbi:type II toxin-antitoxin system RnlB family antitoxin [Lactococcus cremoris]|jgi:hypothetical protein|uniref:type II toxin-antitoxin system RnlB family antitoxin n=1 Tax=Lactococcus lactis subsp. cremoris TaxID=1359 RepID=UPI002599BC9F|nr:type II toxin-antitoxin system RnlB family antitoxin [uncultured Lactococcus sp.]